MKALRTIFLLAVVALLSACASNPVLTGKPQHWKGRSTEELRAGLGEPTEVKQQGDWSEVWIYRKTGEFLAPARENTNFRVGGGAYAAGGSIGTTKRSEQVTDYETVWRFQVKGGKVRRWYAQRIEGGQLVWEDH